MTKQELVLKVMNKPTAETRNLKPRPAETNIKYTNNGCWIWQGEISHFGVPKSGKYSVRRIMYDRYVKGVAKDEIVVSICPYINHLCVSPGHSVATKLK